MRSFISEVVEAVLSKALPISDCTFVLPSRRAGAFLRKELSHQLQEITFAPQIYSIEEFIAIIAGLRSSQNTTLLFEFYNVYLEITPKDQQEPFDVFSKWAQVLLQDFNEIDRHLIDHQQIFSYLGAIKEMDHWSVSQEKTEMVAGYINFWNKLPLYYEQFVKRLLAGGIGYQGLIYREAIDNLEFYLQNNNNHHVFVGFNALNTAESNIIQELLQLGVASIYWDTDVHFFDDPDHDASLFIREHKHSWNYFQQHPFEWIKSNYETDKDIQVIGVPKNIGQAKYVGELLQSESVAIEKTAVVLGEETLLIPILNSIPNNVQTVNITMGFPMSAVPTTSLFSSLFALHQKHKGGAFYYRHVIDTLSHQHIRHLFTIDDIDHAGQVVQQINLQNFTYITLPQLLRLTPQSLHTYMRMLFDSWDQKAATGIGQCLELIKTLKKHLSKDKENQLLSLEYLFRFNEIFSQIKRLNDSYDHIKDIRTLQNIFKELLSMETLDFRGEPLQGLQLMGMLESRVLDFETVILTSANEGVLPSGKSNNSFIPFEVKKQFDLPTYKEKDAVYTYHFYRLLHRAKNVYLLYNTESDGLNAGEPSRFLTQLQVYKQPKHLVTHKVVAPMVPKIQNTLQQVNKNDDIMARLKEIALRGFSPSALTNYVRNPADFYYDKVLGIQEHEQVEETVAANTLGTVIHDSLEFFYKPLEGQFLTLAHINAMREALDEVVRNTFKKVYGAGDILRGKNLIIFEVAKRYIHNFLTAEATILKRGSQLKILQVETDLKAAIDIPELNFPVSIRGKVDRVDQLDGVVRVIDYKTGKVLQNEVELIEWSQLNTDYKYSKIIQILAYAYMINSNGIISAPVEAGIISFKNLQNGFLKFAKKSSSRGPKDHLVTNETFGHYLTELKSLILEICNPNIPFIEKEV